MSLWLAEMFIAWRKIQFSYLAVFQDPAQLVHTIAVFEIHILDMATIPKQSWPLQRGGHIITSQPLIISEFYKLSWNAHKGLEKHTMCINFKSV